MSDIGEQRQDILGRVFHDPVTGYKGVATWVAYGLDQQVRVCLETLKTDGTLCAEWFDRERIKRYNAS